MDDILKDKFIGALMGTFVGDALGMAVEGWTALDIEDNFGELREMQPARLDAGSYTDDTQLMIGIAESLTNIGRIDGADIARHFVENFEPHRGYGFGAIKCLRLLASGMPWESVSAQVMPGGSYGNGAAMRIAPVGVFFYDDAAALRDAAHEASMPTHSHPLALNGGAVQAYAVALATSADPGSGIDPVSFIEKLKGMYSPGGEPLFDKLEMIPSLIYSNPPVDEIVDKLGNDVLIHNSVPAAIYSFLSHPSSAEDAVVAAVGLGGDTDTIGAMTGAIAGACHGYSAFPARWTVVLENGPKGKDYVIQLAEKLHELKTEK
jgi:ADP-ribosylglycohydrolase